MVATYKVPTEAQLEAQRDDDMWWYSLSPTEAAQAARDVCKIDGPRSIEVALLNFSAQAVLSRVRDFHSLDLFHATHSTIQQERISELEDLVQAVDLGLENLLSLAGVDFQACSVEVTGSPAEPDETVETDSQPYPSSRNHCGPGCD